MQVNRIEYWIPPRRYYGREIKKLDKEINIHTEIRKKNKIQILNNFLNRARKLYNNKY